MLRNLKYVFFSAVLALVACTNVSPAQAVKESKFGATGKTLQELIQDHPKFKKGSLIWEQTSPKEGLIVECTYEITEGDGFIVAMDFEVTQKTVMMTRAQIFSKNKSDGIIRHLEPERYIDALESKSSISESAIMPLFINNRKLNRL